MFQSSFRLQNLADGIFAIVMTLLVFEIKAPDLIFPTNQLIWSAISDYYPVFLAYILSFATLFNYWRGYHAVASDFAQSHNHNFENLSAGFLLFVALIPFSSKLLGLYHQTPMAVVIFATNVFIIGLFLFLMREYAHASKEIKNRKEKNAEKMHAHMRINIPIFFSLAAIVIAFVSTNLALSILTIAIIFNLLKRSTHALERIIEPMENKNI